VKAGTCSLCGRPLDVHDRDVRFALPDPIFELPEERRELSWSGEAMVAARGIGQFVRVLVPVRLTGGYSIRFGAWLSVSQDDARHAWEIWDAPAYKDLQISGYLANALPPWGKGVLGASATGRVRADDELPYLVASTNELLARILAREWPHEDVLAALPKL
jgi:hypothetical protein